MPAFLRRVLPFGSHAFPSPALCAHLPVVRLSSHHLPTFSNLWLLCAGGLCAPSPAQLARLTVLAEVAVFRPTSIDARTLRIANVRSPVSNWTARAREQVFQSRASLSLQKHYQVPGFQPMSLSVIVSCCLAMSHTSLPCSFRDPGS